MRSFVFQGIILGKSSILLILLLLSQTSSLCLSKPIRQTPRNTIRQFLLPHNRIRAKLGIPPLKWSPKLASYASWWAHRRRQNCELLHSDGDYGENLFWGSGTDWAPGDAVAAWAKERLYYDYSSNTCKQNKDCWHYTQVVWKESTRVGCAKVICNTGDTLVICNYDPHGNVIGEKPF